MTDRNAQDHMEWCKERALAYVAKGALPAAVASMCSDLHQHPSTQDQTTGILVFGMVQTTKGAEAVRNWIEGFHVDEPHALLDRVEAGINREFAGLVPGRAGDA